MACCRASLEAGISATTHISQRWVVSKLRDANRTVYISPLIHLSYTHTPPLLAVCQASISKETKEPLSLTLSFRYFPNRLPFNHTFRGQWPDKLVLRACIYGSSTTKLPRLPHLLPLQVVSFPRTSPVSAFKRFLTTSTIDSRPPQPFPNTQPGYMQMVQQPPRIHPSYPRSAPFIDTLSSPGVTAQPGSQN